MKRKRGNKKGKSKKKLPVAVVPNEPLPNIVNLSTEDNSGLDDFNNDEIESKMEAETPSSAGTDLQETFVSTNSSGGPIDKSAGKSVFGGVRVKIKSSKTMESQVTSSDALTHSDTDKSSQQQQVGLGKKVVVSEKMEDSANSLPESNLGVSGNQAKKAGSIKIKSKGFSSSSLSPCNNNAGVVPGERTYQKEVEPNLVRGGSRYDKQELNAALEVIKKVMKMDAAEPFNVPVNPIALGIPDYFDVIDMPMDFGTICSNLENGVKYMNSEDVFKDVRCVWENCYKYNNKGDYIVELMKRVKKNFTKYWTAAGLYGEQLQVINGVENVQGNDVAPSSQGKMPVKGGHLKHKSGKRHGVKRHKDDCLCAICVMMRRRQEREENAQIVEDPIETSDGQEVKPQETSPGESPCEDTSSSMDNSPDQNAHADLEDRGKEVKLEEIEKLYGHLQEKQEEEKEKEMTFQTKGEGEIHRDSQLGDRSEEERNRQYQTHMMESGGDIQNDNRKQEISMQHEDNTAAVEHQKPKKSLDKSQKAKMYENLLRFENPMLLELSGILFADDHKSIWNGPHSLVQRQGSTRSSSIHAAVATFMN